MADDTSTSDDLSIKQQREKRRAAKVAALKAKQAKDKRTQRFGIAAAVVAGLAVIGILVGIVVTSATPPVDPAAIEIEGLETFEVESLHVQTAVDYEMTPPVGGPHNPTWLNCGVYEQEVPAEYAVHSLEHGAVWVTYNPDDVSGADLDALRSQMPRTYMILSPFPGLEAPVVASAWGVQVSLDGIDDPRLNDFIVKYRQSPDAPEPGALCSQALDGPGKIS